MVIGNLYKYLDQNNDSDDEVWPTGILLEGPVRAEDMMRSKGRMWKVFKKYQAGDGMWVQDWNVAEARSWVGEHEDELMCLFVDPLTGDLNVTNMYEPV